MEKITVFINGSPKEVEKRDYTFKEVAELVEYNSFKDYTISSTLKDGNDQNIYHVGDKIKMEETMRINVDLTTNG